MCKTNLIRGEYTTIAVIVIAPGIITLRCGVVCNISKSVTLR